MKNTNQLKQEIKTFLLEKECYATYNHCITVGDYAEEIGHEFLNEAEREQVKIAGYLHDISAIYPNNERIFVAEDMKIELFKEERQFPMIIHQKNIKDNGSKRIWYPRRKNSFSNFLPYYLEEKIFKG